MILTHVRRLGDQDFISPRGVDFQSYSLISLPISPPPDKNSRLRDDEKEIEEGIFSGKLIAK
jgi:hypothetical protein